MYKLSDIPNEIYKLIDVIEYCFRDSRWTFKLEVDNTNKLLVLTDWFLNRYLISKEQHQTVNSYLFSKQDIIKVSINIINQNEIRIYTFKEGSTTGINIDRFGTIIMIKEYAIECSNDYKIYYTTQFKEIKYYYIVENEKEKESILSQIIVPEHFNPVPMVIVKDSNNQYYVRYNR